MPRSITNANNNVVPLRKERLRRTTAQGCASCDHTGYSGRRALFDIMTLDQELRDLLEQENTTAAAIQAYLESRRGDVMTAQGFALAAQGITTLDEIQRVTLNVEKQSS